MYLLPHCPLILRKGLGVESMIEQQVKMSFEKCPLLHFIHYPKAEGLGENLCRYLVLAHIHP